MTGNSLWLLAPSSPRHGAVEGQCYLRHRQRQRQGDGAEGAADLGRQQMAPVQLPEGFEVIALSVSLKVQDSIPIDYGSGLTER